MTGPCGELERSATFRSGQSVKRVTQSAAKEIIRMIDKTSSAREEK